MRIIQVLKANSQDYYNKTWTFTILTEHRSEQNYRHVMKYKLYKDRMRYLAAN